MEKLILTFLSRKLKLKKLLKYLKVKKVPTRNFECGKCLKLLKYFNRKITPKVLWRVGKKEGKPQTENEELKNIIFSHAKSRQNSLKCFHEN